MPNFSEFLNRENKTNKDTINKSHNSQEYMKSKIEEYSGYSQDRLINDFVKLTMEKKKRGELSEKELISLKNTIAPMLNNEQKESLEKLLQMVRNVE
jgi:hypothetical protein